MALLFADHTATIYQRSETADPVTKVVPVPTEAGGVEITCQISPIGADVVVDALTGVELKNPYRMRLQPENIDSVPYGARVVWEETGDQFRVTKKPEKHLAGGEVADLNSGLAEMELLEMQP